MQVKTIGETSTLLAMSLLLPFGLCAGELPDGFRQVSYIQSSGTQHIDIDYTLKYGDSFVVEFLPLETPSSNLGVFGHRANATDKDSQNISCSYSSDGNIIADYYDTSSGSDDVMTYRIFRRMGSALNTYDRFVVYSSPLVRASYYGKGVSILDTYGGYNSAGYTRDFTCAGSAWIFAVSGYEGWAPARMRFFGLRVWRGSELACDIVPVVRISDDKPGVYDLARGRFFDNAASGEDFTASEAYFPEGYVELPSITGTGTQYINTGLNLRLPDESFEIVFAPILKPEGENARAGVFGAGNNSSYDKAFSVCCASDGSLFADRNTSDQAGGWHRHVVENVVFNRENWIVVTNAAAFSRVSTGYGKSSFAASTSVNASTAQTFTTVQTATIFASNGMSEWQKAAMRFKRARVMCRDYVVADMVPAKRSSDGKVGVYDLKRRLFLTNAAEEGPDFYEEGVSKFVEYLETDGATFSANNDNPGEAILLDYIPASNSVVKAKVMMRGDDRQGAVFCCRNDNSRDSFTLFYIPSSGGFRWDYNDVLVQYASNGSDVIRYLTASNTGLYVGGTRVLSKTPANYAPANRLMLFASYQATLPKVPKPTSNYAKCRLYSFKVYDGDDLSIDLHPCLNKEGEPGLYDNVSGRIYYNIISGTRFTPSDKEVPAPWQKALVIIVR